jgi:hypothetical protein
MLTSPETYQQIELGSQEQGFFLRGVNSVEDKIIRDIYYLECPYHNYKCRFCLDKHLYATLKPKMPVFHLLFSHYVREHYRLQTRKEHSNVENICFAILQEFVIFESNNSHGGRNRFGHSNKYIKKAIAIHNLMKHQLISLEQLRLILRINQHKLGELAWRGREHCTQCNHSEGDKRKDDN